MCRQKSAADRKFKAIRISLQYKTKFSQKCWACVKMASYEGVETSQRYTVQSTRERKLTIIFWRIDNE